MQQDETNRTYVCPADELRSTQRNHSEQIVYKSRSLFRAAFFVAGTLTQSN